MGKRKPDGTVPEFMHLLKSFLEDVFGKDFLERELRILATHSKNKQQYSFLKEVTIHPAAKWWDTVTKIIQQNNRVNPAMHSQIVEFMESALFFAAFRTLAEKGVISLTNGDVVARLRDRKNFLPFVYELTLAANYVSNGYNVEFPERSNESKLTVDLLVHNESTAAYIECKRLTRRVYWEDVVIEVLNYLNSVRPNSYRITATFPKAPKSPQEARKYSEKVLSALREESTSDVQIKELPTFIIGNPRSLFPPQDKETEYYVSMFGYHPLGIIAEPKVIILRNTGKLKEFKNSVNDRLKQASKQLKNVEDPNVPKIVAIDVTSFVMEIRNIWSGYANEYILQQVDEIRSYIKSRLSKSQHIDGVLITRSVIHLDPYNRPLAVNVVPEYILKESVLLENIPKFKGWSVVTLTR